MPQTSTEARTLEPADLYPVGEMPPPGIVPARMHAYTVRADRFGEPKDAFTVEVVDTPAIGPGEVLVHVMAAGCNGWPRMGAARRVAPPMAAPLASGATPPPSPGDSRM